MHKITCDVCDKDITTTDAMPRFRLTLSCEPLPHDTNMIYAVNVYPPIEREMHFCGMECLYAWCRGQQYKEEQDDLQRLR